MTNLPIYGVVELTPAVALEKKIKAFFEKHLSHLRAEYTTSGQWREYIVEAWYRMTHSLKKCKSKEDVRARLNRMREDVKRDADACFDELNEELENAESEEEVEIILQRGQERVSFFKKLCEGVKALCGWVWDKIKKVTKGIKDGAVWCVEKVVSGISALFNWMCGN